jgi:hypothetical protein
MGNSLKNFGEEMQCETSERDKRRYNTDMHNEQSSDSLVDLSREMRQTVKLGSEHPQHKHQKYESVVAKCAVRHSIFTHHNRPKEPKLSYGGAL